jgi:predicted ATPase/class 3 adenylate cyclase
VADPGRSRGDLPDGTLTLLFTDIEGSTALLRRLGAGYAEVQERHRRLLRAVFARFGGVEVDTQGDSFMAVFRSAHDAVATAAEIHRGLAAESWPEDVRVRVRVGVHTGRPERRSEGYVGIDVVRAARVCSAAHGGQALLSATTREAVADTGVETIDLGTHALKDFPAGERLFQLVGAGLERLFEPLRTYRATNLPVVATPLVGREDELEHVRRLLADPAVRVVTLTGPGGVGKSRLALEAARRSFPAFPDGVYLVRLASISDPGLVLTEIARVVGVRDTSRRSRVEVLSDTLRARRMLLVLDNVEHVVTAAGDVGKLLAGTPGPVVLATGRGRLRITGERVVAVNPLPEGDAVTLFVTRAAAAGVTFRPTGADFEVIADICRRVDCLPLGVELAAARVSALGLDELRSRLVDALGVLTGGMRDVPERQRTLRATIDWSHRLLTPAQQALHASLAVFRGGATPAAAEDVCGDLADDFLADLGELVDSSLVRREIVAGSSPRLRMLATVHQHASEMLERRTDVDALRAAHAGWFGRLAGDAERALEGPEQAAWLAALERDLDNLRAAIEFSLGSGAVEAGLRLVSRLGRFWRAHGHVAEARSWLDRGLAIGGELPDETRAFAHWTAARQAMAQHDYIAAEPHAGEANRLFQALGWTRETVFSLCELASIALERDDLGRATSLAEQAVSMARAAGDARTVSAVLQTRASVAAAQGEHEAVQELYEEALALRRGLGDELLVVDSAYNLGEAAFEAADYERAREALHECLALARDLGDGLHEAAALCVLGETELLDGAVDSADAFLRASIGIYEDIPDDRSSAECLLGLACVSARRGRVEHAARLWGVARELRGDAPLLAAEAIFEHEIHTTLTAALGSRLEGLLEEGRGLDRARLLGEPEASVVRHGAVE